MRECHGDLHLGNIALIDGRVTLFDRLEFNASMRWIDVMNDVAFVIADLQEHKRPDLAARFLTAYLEATGDYEGLGVLRFYLVYRAMVRAKVARFRMRQLESPDEREQVHAEYRRFIDAGAPSQSTAAGRHHHHPRPGRQRQDDLRAMGGRTHRSASAFAPTSNASGCTVSRGWRQARRTSERACTPRRPRARPTDTCARSHARSPGPATGRSSTARS